MFISRSSLGWIGAALAFASAQAATACGSDDESPPAAAPDAGRDASDAGLDTLADTGTDASVDAQGDAVPDGGGANDAGSLPVVIGQPNATSNEGVRLGLALPNDVAIVGSRLLVADQNNSRVLIWNTIPTRNQQQADLVLGQPDFTTSSPNYGGVSARGFRGSNGVASDGTRLIVADRFNYRVLIWNTFPTRSFQPADVVLGQPDFTTSTSNAGGISARSMTEPWVWLGGGKLFVADRSNSRVLIWNSIPTQNQAPADIVLGQPNMTSAVANNGGVSASALADPGKGWVDNNRLFVPDLANHRVLIWNSIPTTNNAPASAVLGQTAMTANAPNAGGALGAVGFAAPIGVYASGNTIAVAEFTNNRVLVWTSPITANGQPASLVLGQPNFTTNTVNTGGLTASSVNTPNSVAGDGTRFVISDRFNHRVLLFASTPTASTAPASLVLGQPDFVSGRVNNGAPVSASTFASPTTAAQLGERFAVVDNGHNRVMIWNSPPSTPNQPASLVLGQPDFTSFEQAGGAMSARSLCAPAHVHSDGTRLVVGEHCARRVTLWNSLPTANQAPADVAVGQPDLSSSTINNGGVSASSIGGRPLPHIDGQRLFVADANNHRVLIHSSIPTTSGRAADLVLGQPNMTSAMANNGGVSARSLSQPTFVYVSAGRVFVADTGNRRVLVWNTVPTANQAPADLVLGKPDMTTTSESPPSARNLGAPRGVHVDGNGRLYVMDSDNHRILFWNAIPTQSYAAADGVIGQPDLDSALANNGGLTAYRLQGPTGLLAIGDRVYISDSGNDRIVVLPRP